MKVAISLPDPVFNAAEQLAHQLKVSRSQLYAEALSAYLGSRGAAAVTAKLNAVYGSESSQVESGLTQAQIQSISHEAW
jgi:metal-responsive CopG/Arc/MetJ family transcriptional regulator